MSVEVQEPAPIAGDPPAKERPIAGYAVTMGAYAAAVGGLAAWMRASRRRLPERVPAGDLALMTVATHKAARLISKERVTSPVRAPFTRFQGNAGAGEVSETARGHGVRRALGELLVCPYCISLWIATAFAAGFAVAPRPTRWTASVLTAVFGSDALQIAYKKAEDAL
jgi:Protein of unknown function (DUF1360)